MKYIDELEIKDKTVFLRLDLNVPISKDGQVTDTTRIEAALPTIKYAIDQGAKLVLASHLGRPKGEPDPTFSLKPVAAKLAEFLNKDIIFPEDCIGDAVRKLASELRSGDVMLLENLRFHKEEKENDEGFAKKLANLCEVYINDAFGTAHRAHASTAGMAKFFNEKGAGFLMKKEVEVLTDLLENAEKPYIAIIGGAKVSDKLGVVENLLGKVDAIIIGGGMAYTFLKAKGHAVGKSLLENKKLGTAKKTIERAVAREVPFLLPVDHVCATEFKEGAEAVKIDKVNIPDNLMGLDIGEKTVALFAEKLAKAKTIFWNGPMGVCEIEPFNNGTFELARAIAKTDAYSVVGGGDSIAAIKRTGVAGDFSHICTGGGASLEFLEGKKLPGIVALG